MRKKAVFIMAISFMFMILISNAYAVLGDGTTTQLPIVTQNKTGIASKFYNLMNNVGGTIMFILKVLSVAGIAIQGVRYMYAGPQDKGQIKQSLIYIVIGTILVFGVSIVVDLVTGAWNSI